MTKYSRIKGIGSYLPEKIVTNYDLAQIIDTTDEWIISRTGIQQRHNVTEQTTSDLAQIAAQKALEDANLLASELDLIIVATTTPDSVFPSTASLLQHKIGANCPAFDIQAVCAGFIYALETANNYIKCGSSNNILVVGAETLSKIVDKNDRNTAVLFGDGAGAVVLSSDNETGILHSKLYADGSYNKSLYVDNKTGYINMQGNQVFKIAIDKLSDAANEAIKAANIKHSELDWMVPHQANIRIIQAVAKRIKQPISKVIITVNKHANTSAASIPLAMDYAVKDGRIKKGDTCLLEGIGGGFVWGSVLLRY